jgi:hypothetical protein
MAHEREDTPKRYSIPDFYDDEALAALHDSSQNDGPIHIPTLARRTLERLLDVGLLPTSEDDLPPNVRRVRWVGEGTKQELWIRADTYRDPAGYPAVEVLDTSRSNAAIVAAMTAFVVAEPIDFEQLSEAMAFIISPAHKEQEEKAHAFHQRLHEGAEVSLEELREHTKSVLALHEIYRVLEPLPYVMSLVRDYKPEIVTLSSKELSDWLKMVCDAIDEFLEGRRKLLATLEYGAPERNLVPAIKNAKRDMRAAILRDVDGLSTLEIGERMRIPLPGAPMDGDLPEDSEALKALMKDLREKNKGEHQTVRKMVGRGRRILEDAFGKEAWQQRVEIMKAEKVRWRSLSPEERDRETDIEMSALNLGISVEEARRRAEDRRS